MSQSISFTGGEQFAEISHQGKTIKIGDRVIVREAGQERVVVVSSILKKQNHYWVGYDENQSFYPWPLVRRAE